MTRFRQLWQYVLLAWLAWATAPGAAQEKSFDIGSQVFRYTLGMRFRPLDSVEALLDDPEHSVVFLTGDTGGVAEEHSSVWLNSYLNRGGSLLLATDQATSPNLNRMIGIAVAGKQVTAPDADPDAQYKGNTDCPIVVGGGHPIFSGLGKLVATNRPSYVIPVELPPANREKERCQFKTIAAFPLSCEVNGLRGRRNFAAAATERHRADWEQRVLVLADQSVFINGMMLQDDNANMQFANHCMNWLSEDGRRTRALYIDDGQIVPDFSVRWEEIPLTPPALPPNLPAPPAAVIDNIVAAWQDDNVHNQLLMERFSLNQILGALAIVLTVLVCAYGVTRLRSAAHSTEPGR